MFPENVTKIYYYAFVHPYLSYSIESWYGNLSKQYKRKLFALQKRAIRIIKGADFLAHTRPLFEELQIKTLEKLYLYRLSCLMYRILNNNVTLLSSRVTALTHPIRTRAITNNQLTIPRPRLNYGLRSLTFSSISVWNSLPSNIRTATTYKAFRKQVNNFLQQNQTEL